MLLFAFILPFGFAALAVNLRRRSRGVLWTATAVAVAIVIGLALVLSSAWAGNRLVSTEGYGRVASGVLTEFGFEFVLPILTAAIAADLFRAHRRVLAIAMFATAIAIAVGIVVAVRVMWAG